MGLILMGSPVQDGSHPFGLRLGLGLMDSGLAQEAWRHVAKPLVGLGHRQAHEAPHPKHKGAEEVVGHPYPTEARHFGFGHLGPSLMAHGVLVHRDPGLRSGYFIPFCLGGGPIETLGSLFRDGFEALSGPVGIQYGSSPGEEGHSHIADVPEVVRAAEAQPGQDHHRQHPLPGGQAGDGYQEGEQLGELEEAAPQEHGQKEPKAPVGAVADDRWFFPCPPLFGLWGSPCPPISPPDGTDLLVDVTQIAGGAAEPGGNYCLWDADGLEDKHYGPKQDTAVGVSFENLQQGMGHNALLFGEREGQGFDRFGRRDYNSHWTRLHWGGLDT